MKSYLKGSLSLVLVSFFLISPSMAVGGEEDENPGCCARLTRAVQNFSYQVMGATFWDYIMGGFRPGRVRAMEQLQIEESDRILLVGEGSGLDFEVLPETATPENVWALDYSTVMVGKAKRKALIAGIPVNQCVQGDAQALTFGEGEFNKIFFPLSLGSIPDPSLALREAERVLAPGGRIVLIEKLVDDGETPSFGRRLLNRITVFVFADINRNLTDMMGAESPLKIIHYESMRGKLTGVFGRLVGPYYRVAELVRTEDYPHTEAAPATINRVKVD